MHVTHKDIVDKVAEAGPEAKAAAEKLDYGLFTAGGFEQSIKDDVGVLKAAPTLKGMNIYGFKLDTFSGEIEAVEA